MGSNGEPQGVSSTDRDINVSSRSVKLMVYLCALVANLADIAGLLSELYSVKEITPPFSKYSISRTSSFWRPPLHDPTFLAHIILPDRMPPSHIFSVAQPQQPLRHPPCDNLYRSRNRARGDYGSVGRRHQSYHRNSLGRQTLNHRSLAIPTAYNSRRHPPVDTSYPNASLGPLHLSRKPRTWRGGYKSPSKGGFLSRLSSFLARMSFSNQLKRFPISFYDLGNPTFNRPHVHLNPLISYRPRRTDLTVIYNMRFEPLPHLGVHFLQRPATTLDYYQLATSPPVDRLTLWHPKLPWYIKVRASTPYGVTIHDVLFGIYTQLRRPISQDEYYTDALTARDREMLGLAFEERCGGDIREIAGGVRRVDFLGREAGFIGLVRSRKGVWELKSVATERLRMAMVGCFSRSRECDADGGF